MTKNESSALMGGIGGNSRSEEGRRPVNVEEIIARTNICDLWRALGGAEPHRGRARAFYRDGKSNRGTSIDTARGCWYDHGERRGGGVLALIERATGCNRRGAVDWLAAYHGVSLGRQTDRERQEWKRRRAEAERQAEELTEWRQEQRQRLILDRNAHYNAYNAAARWRSRNRGKRAGDWRWTASRCFGFDRALGDRLNAELEALERMAPGELAACRKPEQQRRAA